ncbi:MAG: hypothetical protein H6607_07165 [Flavobacteriales bacterium]|nr:hypothetical protein [Flavobacteriales bacterium]
MIVQDFISTDLPLLKPSDTVQYAQLMLEDFGVENLLIVDGKDLKGYAQRLQLEAENPESSLAEISDNQPVSTLLPEHSVFEVWRVMSEAKLEVVGVLAGNELVGMVWQKDVMRRLGQTITSQNDGAVLMFLCNQFDYSISLIGRIVEAEDGKILGILTNEADDGKLEVLLKLNIQYVDTICNILESHGFKLIHRVNRKRNDMMEDRYKSLINYLDI